MSEIELPQLTVEDFRRFFEEVHNNLPFPWQERLLRRVAAEGWPAVLDLPTGAGKTAALDIAVFHLALEATLGEERQAPVRIAFVVDRRLVVDDAFERAKRIAYKLANAEPNSIAGRVATRLRFLAGDNEQPLMACQMRGGLPREDSWANTPSQPAILCSTVDQVGSRLLFRGYGISDRMKPVQAGLIGSDCLILLDEAHLSEPFRQTLDWVALYKGQAWREESSAPPWKFVTLTATPGAKESHGEAFRLNESDRKHALLKRRFDASKTARLVSVDVPRSKATQDEPEDTTSRSEDEKLLTRTLVDQALDGLRELQQGMEAARHPALAVVVNRVLRARRVFDELKTTLGENADTILLIGPCRQVDKDTLVPKLAPIHTGAIRSLDRPLIIVATQCLEAGVDIDLDGLITEAAPLDALRQRFGRVNRDGRSVRCIAAIVGQNKSKDDPVYGNAIRETWAYLEHIADVKNKVKSIDFGIDAFLSPMRELEAEPELYAKLLSPKADAPVLMPAHLNLLAQTSPIPASDPEVSLYLHGPGRSVDAVTVVWRADLDPKIDRNDERTRRVLTLIPPRAAEAIELPAWAVRQWLATANGLESLADVPTEEGKDQSRQRQNAKPVFLWVGNDERSLWIDSPHQIRSGSTIVVPARYGGLDQYGWNSDSRQTVTDIAFQAAKPIQSRRYAIRVAPGLLGKDGEQKEDALASTLAAHEGDDWQNLRQAVRDAISSEHLRQELDRLNDARGNRRDKVQFDLECYGRDEQDRPRGIIFYAPRGLKSAKEQREHAENWPLESIEVAEDDFSGLFQGFDLPLEDHSHQVQQKAELFARAAALSNERINDLRVAALLHDTGKADTRFQAWLAYGDPLGTDPKHVLAKSARRLPPIAREKSGLPPSWRHEAFSVRLAPRIRDFEQAADKELVLWLIGTHHGYGRPFFPHGDPMDDTPRTSLPQSLGIPAELPAGPGPQSLAYETESGLEWCSLFEILKARYGLWELARMEAILRLADHRASAEVEATADNSIEASA